MGLPTSFNCLQILAFVALGFFICWGLLAFILFRWFDVHDRALSGRDFHHANQAPVPRLGGVGLIFAFIVVALTIFFTQHLDPYDSKNLVIILLSSLAMFALGFWDDLHPLRAQWKLAVQIAIAAAVYFGEIRIEIMRNPVTETDFALGMFSFVATVIWLVTLTNLINLIDGIDGLAGGICLMLMFLLATVGSGSSGAVMLLAIGMGGALLGFLKFNYPPARIYMGDGGAYFIGFLIGILSIVNSNKGTVIAALIAPTFALALPFVDASLAVLRRSMSGLPLFRPDRKHIHHHLISLGFSREGAVLTLYTVSLACLFIAFAVFYWQGRLLPLFTGILFLVLVVSGHLSGYVRNWFTIGSRIGKSFALRKETRYALTLSRWLQMEAQRKNSLKDLWQDYQFVISRLEFSRVRLASPHLSCVWQSEKFQENSSPMRHICHEMSHGIVLDFEVDKDIMAEIHFELLSDLAAEAWYKAVSRWRVDHQVSIEAAPAAVPPAEAVPEKKKDRVYTSRAAKSDSGLSRQT